MTLHNLSLGPFLILKHMGTGPTRKPKIVYNHHCCPPIGIAGTKPIPNTGHSDSFTNICQMDLDFVIVVQHHDNAYQYMFVQTL